MGNDAYYNSDNLVADGHANWLADQEYKQREEMIRELDCDFERFPLPICFDAYAEQRELNLRVMHIRKFVERWQDINRIRFNKKYKSHDADKRDPQ